jgi:flagellar biosynthesis protein FlhA
MIAGTQQSLLLALQRHGIAGIPLKALAVPVFILAILTMMMLPLPAIMLDFLFTFNIALSLVVMMVAAYSKKPLDFAVFPTILLLTTLMRLSLNVASTRVVLMDGHTGPGAAGKVIEAFGHVMIGGNFAVGIILFIILMVINFMVVTKGAGRIAEVSARFTLDALPGKQMAIDADLNAGIIDQNEAKRRRMEVGQEADFYGSMDGASKFVRGDAIAGIIILLITIVGGLIVGVAQHGLPLATAANNYVLLAIGDGLVAQIPALIISVAAALLVSRVGGQEGEDVGGQMIRQVFSIPRALALTAGVMCMLGIIPGMPHFVFLSMAAVMGYLSWWMANRKPAVVPAEITSVADAPQNNDATWEDLQPVDPLGMEVGYRLISLVDKGQDGELLKRIKAIRKKFAQDVGFLPPQVHIRDNLEMKPSGYRLTVKGVVVAEGEAFNGMFMAINPGHATGALQGTPTKDPAFGLPAVWIESRLKEQAQLSGYTVVDSATVIATHLSQVLHIQAASLLGREETQALVDHITKHAPKLIEDIVPKLIPLSTFQKLLQNLLDEGVHIRDLRSIIEVIAENASRTQSADELTVVCRIALGDAIVQQLYGRTDELAVIALDHDMERMLLNVFAPQSASSATGGENIAMEPNLADMLFRRAAEVANAAEDQGLPPVLLVPDRLRAPLARLLKRAAPRLRVIAHAEIPETSSIRVNTVLGAQS